MYINSHDFVSLHVLLDYFWDILYNKVIIAIRNHGYKNLMNIRKHHLKSNITKRYIYIETLLLSSNKTVYCQRNFKKHILFQVAVAYFHFLCLLLSQNWWQREQVLINQLKMSSVQENINGTFKLRFSYSFFERQQFC